MLPVWVTQDKGLSAEHGLSTEVITFQGGSTTIQALLSGEVKISATSDTAPALGARAPRSSASGVGELSLICLLRLRRSIGRKNSKGKRSPLAASGVRPHYAVRLVASKWV